MGQHARRLITRVVVGLALGMLLISGGHGLPVAQAAAPPASASFDEPPVDSDGDGVPDDTDQCQFEPGVPENYGCPYLGPTDSDGDGVYDDTDQCQFEPGVPENYGCPVSDQDGDGLTDDVDACPTLPGPYDGCPLTDMDGDGVYDDGTDQCPNEAGPADNQGCPAPDEDGDGFPDATDGCPGTPQGENVDGVGCSLTQLDADNDGLNDEVDQCDDTPDGDEIDQFGCTVANTPEEDIAVTAAAVVFTDRCGVSQDTMTVPTTVGVAYFRGNKKLRAGTFRATGKVTVTARAQDGYALEGTSTWTQKLTNVRCP
jgi:Thrombospondin type 3 repeat